MERPYFDENFSLIGPSCLACLRSDQSSWGIPILLTAAFLILATTWVVQRVRSGLLRPTKRFLGLTWLGWLNYVVLQWFFVRLVIAVFEDPASPHHNRITGVGLAFYPPLACWGGDRRVRDHRVWMFWQDRRWWGDPFKSGEQGVTEKCPVCGDVNDADKEHNCGSGSTDHSGAEVDCGRTDEHAT